MKEKQVMLHGCTRSSSLHKNRKGLHRNCKEMLKENLILQNINLTDNYIKEEIKI